MFSNYYSTLDQEQVTRIHEASLEVLQTRGIRLSHTLALEQLAAAGARVDPARERVCTCRLGWLKTVSLAARKDFSAPVVRPNMTSPLKTVLHGRPHFERSRAPFPISIPGLRKPGPLALGIAQTSPILWMQWTI